MLYEKLSDHASSGAYPMHMPGHKRNTELLPSGLPYGIDITEIHGFDDLRYLRGVLGETSKLAAILYGSRKAFLLINGSTAGNLAAIGAHAKRGDKALFTKSCHRSIHNAVDLFGLEAVHLAVETDVDSGVECSIAPSAVEASLDGDPEIRLVVITSPTYEGVISDVKSIADIAHKRGIPLLVDSAHGAHLGFSAAFPESAVSSGADVVVMSLHKTLPALTQCSLLHICSERANASEIERLLFILQTSSPSYVLMASIDHCLRLLVSGKERLFSEYEQNLKAFYSALSGLERLSLIMNTAGRFETEGCEPPVPAPPHAGFYAFGRQGDGDCDSQGFRNTHPPAPLRHSMFHAFDPGKIVIVTANTDLTGFALAEILRNEHRIELEAAHPNYAIAMTSICDSKEGFSRLATALMSIDRKARRT